MSLSDRGRGLINQPQLEEPLYTFLTLNHPTWAAPLRYVNCYRDLTISGVTYQGRFFKLPMPAQSRTLQAETVLTIDNADREVSYQVASILDRRPGSAEVFQAFATTLDVVEVGPAKFEWSNPVPTGADYTMTLKANSMLQENYPMQLMRPGTYPGLF